MSVLLTSAKKKVDPKSKQRKSSSSSLGSCPPITNSVTSVWYWKLNGVLTTLMYSRDTDEIWCNGFTLEARRVYDVSYGNMAEFTIFLDDKGSSHGGQLLRDQVGNPLLYVDGNPIPVYTG